MKVKPLPLSYLPARSGCNGRWSAPPNRWKSPAGKFDNLVRINRKTSIDVSHLRTNIEDSEVNLSTTLTLDTDLWYAPDLGLVKQQINSVYLKFYGINFPVDIKGAIELQSFTIH